MPFDGIWMHQVTEEVSAQVLGARVDKIHQPAKETVILTLRSRQGSRKLMLSAAASAPRFHLTELPQDNPQSPPMFCMLLRKHLSGAKITDFHQVGLDRVLHIRFDAINEMGDPVVRTLSLEIMGRHSNLILLDENNTVMDAVKRISGEMSRLRPVLPGIAYTLPPAQDRLSLLSFCGDMFWARLMPRGGLPLSKALGETLEGVSPLVAREISFAVSKGQDTPPVHLTPNQKDLLLFTLSQLSRRLLSRQTQPFLLLDKQGAPKDYTYLPLQQYGHTMVYQPQDSFCRALDTFYAQRDQLERLRQRGADLLRLLVNLTDRVSRRLAAQKSELMQTAQRHSLREMGDLLSANQYRLQKGMSGITVENIFLPDTPPLHIPLEPHLSPSQNIQKYYAAYRKADTADKILHERIAQGELELLYLDSVFDALTRSSLESELIAIRQELELGGYLRKKLLPSPPKGTKHPKHAKSQKQKSLKLPPFTYRSDDGFTILCGRNNLQNESLALRQAHGGDLWLHVQNQAGAHVIVQTQGQAVPPRTLEQAAVIAVCHSKLRDSGKAAVDYTLARNLRKHPAAKPGLLLYTPFQTIIVQADPALLSRLSVPDP